jgi:hypothetical protein
LTLLHADSSGSKTWFLDACGPCSAKALRAGTHTRHRHRRLLLSNYDTGVDLTAGRLQPELDFVSQPRELFSGHEMGEDELRLLKEYLALVARIEEAVREEVPRVREAAGWAVRRMGRRKAAVHKG